jgi:AsmA protein
MNKLVKFVVLPVVVIVVVIAAVIAYVAATFDPNAYKPQIVQAVKDKYQRNLKLAGDIKLAFFPSIGAKVANVSLSERGSDREFAGADELQASVKLMPLLSKHVVVDEIAAKNLRAHLVRHKDGTTNIDDLTGTGTAAPQPEKPKAEAGGAAPVDVDISGVAIQNAALTYVDEASGDRLALSKLDLKTGRIAPNVKSKIDLAVTLQREKPAVSLNTSLKSVFLFDPAQQHFVLEGLDLTAKGSAAGLTDLVAAVKGDIDARLATKEFQIAKVSATVSGKQAGGDLSAKLDMPRVAVTRDKVTGDKVTVEATMNEPKQKLVAKLEVGGLEGNGRDFKAARLNGTVDMQREGATTKAVLDTSLAGSVEAQRFDLPKFTMKVSVNDPKLPKNPVEATLTGSARADLAKQLANIDFATKLDDSNINGKAGVTRFSPLALTFDLAIDQLDADRYMAKDTGGKPGAKPAGDASSTQAGKAQNEQPLDLSALKGLDVKGSVRVGSLKVANVRSSQVRLDVRIANGRLDVNPIAANLYQGSLSGALSVQAVATPTVAVKQTLTGINVGPLLKDAANFDMLEGRGNVSVDLAGQGATVTAIRKALAGNAAIKLTDGSVKGINIAATIRDAKAKIGSLKGERTQGASATEKTDFSELSGTFNVKNGVAHNNDLDGKSPLLRLGGAGDIDIGNETLDYVLKATVVATAAGQGGKELAELKGVTVPVHLTGSFNAPQYKIDYGSMAADIAKAAVGAKGDELKARVQDQLKDRLKGLFGR